MSETSRVTEAGRTTIPEVIREQYGIEPGDEVNWEETDSGIVVRKHIGQGARGMLVPEGTSAETRERVAEALEQRVVTVDVSRAETTRPTNAARVSDELGGQLILKSRGVRLLAPSGEFGTARG